MLSVDVDVLRELTPGEIDGVAGATGASSWPCITASGWVCAVLAGLIIDSSQGCWDAITQTTPYTSTEACVSTDPTFTGS